jgi:hypothetical protein
VFNSHGQQKKIPSQYWQNPGCHMVPSDWATCHPVIGPYDPVTNTIINPVTFHITCRTTMCHAMSASILPHHHLYCPITLPHQLSYSPATLPRQHLYNDLSFILQCVSLSLGHVMYRMPRVIHTLPHVNFILVQLSPKTPKLSDTCHLLVLPCVLANVILTS